MARNGEEVATGNSVRTFRRVIGGELPLSEEAAALWLEDRRGDIAAVKTLCEIYGSGVESARWLRYGRSALGLALDLCGVGPTDIVAIPPYQCRAVINKVASRSGNWQMYALDDYLQAVPHSLLELGRVARVVVACVYFGSERIESRLGELEKALLAMSQSPWVVEDRVMCFPDPESAPLWEGRCDFALLSFRKHYPVPDGALLIACSDRAQEALSRCSKKFSGEGDDRDSAVRRKVLAKVKRHAWLLACPLVDDPELNGVKESISSEAILDMVADSPDTDSLPGTTASASYILGRGLARDAREVRAKSRMVVNELLRAGSPGMTLNLRDCGGVGVPLLVDERELFRRKAAEAGVFLPVHWPSPEGMPVCPSVRHWYAHEVTVPIILGASAGDEAFLVDVLRQSYRALREDRDR